ncbi:MAG: transketolase [Clostridia bacterium]|nr:transketolase [Clostridia bacterium]MBN2883247.1 transketolase [Clostridia bacterium]
MKESKKNTEDFKGLDKIGKADIDQLAVNTIRFLSIDAIQKANSGHPGLPMGAAPMAYVLWTRFLRHNPKNPHWFNRDRFVLSAGHGSMLLYSLLHLTGYDLPMEQIKQFRQWDSLTPGHPERGVTPGVEVTTGPLGQGFGNSLGMAMAEAFLAARYNRPDNEIINHYTYCLVGDGDLMEGVATESASLAGHLGLGKLICLYDDNRITLSAATDLTFTENVKERFNTYGWHTQSVDDGNNLNSIENAIKNAQLESNRPSLILVRTQIGYGSPNKQGSFEAHGSPLGENEVRITKQNLGWPQEPSFYIPDSVSSHFLKAVETGTQLELNWEEMFSNYEQGYPELALELRQTIKGELPGNWDSTLPKFTKDESGLPTRKASGKVLNALADKIPALLGGSADLNPSTYTELKNAGNFGSPSNPVYDPQGSAGGGWDYSGKNIHFGVREHGMGAILNGLAAHGGIMPFGATFLIFSDYMRPSIRLAALMDLHVIYVFTHDSISVGEDGPTHQPVEQLLGLRSIPNMTVIRPADANETLEAWRIAIEHRDGPVALALTRQNVPILDLEQYPQLPQGVRAGGYILTDPVNHESPEIILISTGSEVHLALAAYEKLATLGIPSRVVSLPCWNIFKNMPEEYRRMVLPSKIPMLAIEAGTPLGWEPYFGSSISVVGIDHFGASAPGETLMQKFGFDLDAIVGKAQELAMKTRE